MSCDINIGLSSSPLLVNPALDAISRNLVSPFLKLLNCTTVCTQVHWSIVFFNSYLNFITARILHHPRLLDRLMMP